MAEINDWSTSAASNTTLFPEGMSRASVNNGMREVQAILKRLYADNNGSLATAGTSTAITVTLNSQHSAWFDGLTFAARITTTCGATPTINPTGSGALGAKSLYWAGSGTQLAANDLTSTAVAWFMYEATSDKVYVYAAPPYAINSLLTTRGDIATRDASTPVRLAIGAASTVLRSDGTDASWGKVAGAHIAMGSDAQGDVLYHNGTSYARLGAGTSGQFLKTQGVGANPQWADAITTGTQLSKNPYATSSTTTQAHGLGVKPKGYLMKLICLTAEGNWSIGDEIIISHTTYTSNAAGGWLQIDADTTNVNLRISAVAPQFINKTTFAAFTITAANWKVTIDPFTW